MVSNVSLPFGCFWVDFISPVKLFFFHCFTYPPALEWCQYSGSHRSLCLSSFLQSVWRIVQRFLQRTPKVSWRKVLLVSPGLTEGWKQLTLSTSSEPHFKIQESSGTSFQWFSWLWVRLYGMQQAILMTWITVNWIIFLQLTACFLYQTYPSISLALKVQSTGINPACDTF